MYLDTSKDITSDKGFRDGMQQPQFIILCEQGCDIPSPWDGTCRCSSNHCNDLPVRTREAQAPKTRREASLGFSGLQRSQESPSPLMPQKVQQSFESPHPA